MPLRYFKHNFQRSLYRWYVYTILNQSVLNRFKMRLVTLPILSVYRMLVTSIPFQYMPLDF